MEQTKWILILRGFVLLTGIVGCALYLGSIAVFIVMNAMVKKHSSVQAIYWQRMFLSNILSLCTIPGICILTVSCFASAHLQPHPMRTNLAIAGVLNGLIVVNAFFFLSPLIKKVSAIAVEQMKTSAVIPAYSSLKKTEDRLGMVSVILLVTSLLLICFQPFG